ncbi:MAG: glycosyltransferase family 4 protein [Bacteroidales bacterium]|nr:glycosyltransferase family 4 protein [Bacteroidales bacterium]
MVKKTALLITYHNWKGKRQGGFHKFAEAFCRSGYDVGFLSFPRPWYGILKNTELHNAKVLWNLICGEQYKIDNSRLVNFTVPTFGIPGPIRKYVSNKMCMHFDLMSLPDITTVCRYRFPNVDVMMYESTIGIMLYNELRKIYPQSMIIYRPSDPLVADHNNTNILLEEEKYLMKNADIVFLVDDYHRIIYNKSGIIFGNNMYILPNGIDVESYSKKYYKRKENKIDDNVLYLGAQVPDWRLLIHLAKALPSCTIKIVCPERPKRKTAMELSLLKNIIYIDGVMPDQVPELVMSCNVFVVPYQNSDMRIRNLGLTAKLLQAIAARKPIVAKNVNPALKKYGIQICGSENEFIARVRDSMNCKEVSYSINIDKYDWNKIQNEFIGTINKISNMRTYE